MFSYNYKRDFNNLTDTEKVFLIGVHQGELYATEDIEEIDPSFEEFLQCPIAEICLKSFRKMSKKREVFFNFKLGGKRDNRIM